MDYKDAFSREYQKDSQTMTKDDTRTPSSPPIEEKPASYNLDKPRRIILKAVISHD